MLQSRRCHVHASVLAISDILAELSMLIQMLQMSSVKESSVDTLSWQYMLRRLSIHRLVQEERRDDAVSSCSSVCCLTGARVVFREMSEVFCTQPCLYRKRFGSQVHVL